MVSGSRFIGTTTDNQSFIEVACADGNPGFIIKYTSGPLAATEGDRLRRRRRSIAGGCQMPANQKH